MSIARFNIINSETTTLEINNTSNDNIDLCSGGGNVTINNDLNIIGFIQTPTTIDTTNSEALLVRKDADGGDIFTVNSSLNSVSITSSELQLNGPISGIPTLQGKYIHFINNTFTDNNTVALGTATNMIFNSLDQPTLAATNTSVTTTNAATMYIQGAPIAGINQTITNSYSLWVDSGISRLDGILNLADTTSSSSSTIGTLTSSGGISISNTTDAISVVNGGTFTTAGGVSIAKKIFIGGAAFIGNTLDMNNTKIINVADPTATSDVATKNYVDSVAQGLDIKDSVRVTTTGPGTLSTDFENGDIVDNTTLVTGDRILIKDQTNGVENGIYIVEASGSPTRSIEFAAGSSQSGAFTFVREGTINQDSGWVVTNDPPNDVVGTDALVFSQFSGAGQIIAGTGLSKSGNTLSVNASQTQITELGTLVSLTVSPGLISGVDLNLSGLIASQAIFTDASKNLISVATTGSGNAVLQTTPTLITPNIGVASGTSLTVTNDISSSQGIFSDSINLKNTTFTSNNNDILLNANNDSIFLRNNIGSANGEFESSISIFKFRNSSDTGNILQINKSTEVSTFTGIVDITSTITSTSNITGALTLDGGIGISNTTDATSVINGGTFTTAGGISIAKKAFIGGNVTIGNTALNNGLLNVFGDLTDGGIRVIPSTSGNETSIAFYRNNDTTSVTTGDIWTVGRGQTNDRDFYIKNNTRTSLSISSVSNAVVIGSLNQALNSNILTFGGVTGDLPIIDTSLVTVISERLYDSAEDKFNNPSITNASADPDFSELLILKGNNTTTNIDRVRIVAPSFAIDIPSNGVLYDGQNNNITVPSGLIARAFEISPLNRTVNVLNNNQDGLVAINPSAGDIIRQVSFNGANNQLTAVDVTGLSFVNTTTRSFKVQMSVVIDATSDLFAQFTLEGVQNSTGWYFIYNFIGDDTLITFTITSTGQVQYTSSNYAGFVSLTMKFKAQTIAI